MVKLNAQVAKAGHAWQYDVWRVCTRLTSLELAAFALFPSYDDAGLNDVPLSSIECLQLHASDFDIEKSRPLLWLAIQKPRHAEMLQTGAK